MANLPYPSGANPSIDFSTINLKTSTFSPQNISQGIVDNYSAINNATMRNTYGTHLSALENFVNTTFLGRSTIPILSGFITNVVGSRLVYNSGVINYLSGIDLTYNSGQFVNLNVTNNGYVKYISGTNLNYNSGLFINLTSTNGNITNIIGNTLDYNTGIIDTLTGGKATYTSGVFTQLDATIATIPTLNSTIGNITTLNASSGNIDIGNITLLKSKTINVNDPTTISSTSKVVNITENDVSVIQSNFTASDYYTLMDINGIKSQQGNFYVGLTNNNTTSLLLSWYVPQAVPSTGQSIELNHAKCKIGGSSGTSFLFDINIPYTYFQFSTHLEITTGPVNWYLSGIANIIGPAPLYFKNDAPVFIQPSGSVQIQPVNNPIILNPTNADIYLTTTTSGYFIRIEKLPISSNGAGLPTGCVYKDSSGFLKIV